MERKSLDSKKRGRETEDASSSSAKKSKFLRSLTIPDVPPKSSDQPYKLDPSKREIGESSTKDYTRREVSKEHRFDGEIHKVLMQHYKATQEIDEIMDNKVCSILSKGNFDSQLKGIRQALDACHTTCMKAGDKNDPLTEPYEKFKDTLHEYSKITEELRTHINTELKTLIPTSSWEASSTDSLKSLETHICKNIREVLSDEKINPADRRKIIEAIGAPRVKDIAPDLVEMLPNQQIDLWVRCGIANTIGVSGNQDVIPDLVKMLPNKQISIGVRHNIADAIGVLGNQDVVPDLVKMLPNEQIDSDIRSAITGAIGVLGNQDVAPDLVKMLPNQQIDASVRCRIATAIRALGNQDVASGLVKMLPNEKIYWKIRCEIAKTIGTLDDKGVIPALETILHHDKQIRKRVSSEIHKTLTKLRARKPTESSGD